MTNYVYDGVIQSGTAQAGGSNTITLASGASSTDDNYNGCSVTIILGTGQGQVKLIIDYAGSTKIATVDSNWSAQPDNTSQYQVKQYPAWVNGRDVVSAERLQHIENDGCKAAHSELITHQSSGDHDSRYPVLSSNKVSNSYLNTGSGNGLDADTVDGIQASPVATANQLFPLDANTKIPNAQLYMGIGNGMDADKWDGLNAPSNTRGYLENDGSGSLNWNNPTLTGSRTHTESQNNGQDYTYTIALGSYYTSGWAFVRSNDNLWSFIHFTTNNMDAYSFGGYTDNNNNKFLYAITRSSNGIVTRHSNENNCWANGWNNYCKEMYISGTNLVYVLRNDDTGTRSLTCTIYYEVKK